MTDREPGAVVAWLVTDTETDMTRVSERKAIEGASWMKQDALVLATDYEYMQEKANLARELYEAMRARAEAAAKDAARYGYLRDTCGFIATSVMAPTRGHKSVMIDFDAPGDDLDAAIDTAIAEQERGG